MQALSRWFRTARSFVPAVPVGPSTVSDPSAELRETVNPPPHADDAALEALQARFDLVRRVSNDGLWDMEAIGGQVDASQPFWWSDQFRRLLGFASEADFPNVLGSWSSRLHPDDVEPTLSAFSAHLADTSGRTPYDVRYRLRLRDETYRWFRAQGQTIRHPNGEPIRVAGSLTDIHDEMERDAELELMITRFNLARELLNDGLWDMSVVAGDPINPKNAFWWSPQFRQLLGFGSTAEFPDVLDSWASRLHPEDKDLTLQAFVDHLNDKTGQTPYDVHYRVRCKDGDYRWFRARGQTSREADGTPLRAVGVLTDVQKERDRVAAEQARERQAEATVAAAGRIGELVSDIQLIAHQTNIVSLNATIEAARLGHDGKGFGVIADEIRRLAHTTRQLTDQVADLQGVILAGVNAEAGVAA
ncbi:methyl-accepting chemotaxis protein [Luteibacter sahnii]|uniref:methyl-accepting chemotaxis protein n=1 Tax=Luteibacter sahnii TaxID=3021977 RepID=UPI002A6A6991|nr:PAS domain-containing protein [Luteibacter sp. PPL193]MDY1549430.1 PAS domain-containing protein [Luteibacter sp. PPL193]